MIDTCDELNVAEKTSAIERASEKKITFGYFSKSWLWINSFDWIKSVAKCNVDIDLKLIGKKAVKPSINISFKVECEDH